MSDMPAPFPSEFRLRARPSACDSTTRARVATAADTFPAVQQSRGARGYVGRDILG
jgi:hypothetical protein